MDLTPATATTLLAAAAALAYTGSCAWWPFARCGPCTGTGKRSRRDGKVFRPCWWCKGTGRRLRYGRRVFNALRRRRDAAQ